MEFSTYSCSGYLGGLHNQVALTSVLLVNRLIEKTSLDSLDNYFKNIGNGFPGAEAFQLAFGFSKEEFYGQNSIQLCVEM